ncbi:hypothetical protein AOLI_G00081090 [Acnodon oligacanthus]
MSPHTTGEASLTSLEVTDLRLNQVSTLLGMTSTCPTSTTSVPQAGQKWKKAATEPETFASHYVIGKKLGQGGFGSVFKGRYISDGLQVAIKLVPKQPNDRYLYSPDESKAVPVEVALMQMMSRTPICKNIIQLIEWFDESARYILVLERPDTCVDLESFTENSGDYAEEEAVRAIMLQAVDTVSQCSMDQDIKLENFLINTDTSELIVHLISALLSVFWRRGIADPAAI